MKKLSLLLSLVMLLGVMSFPVTGSAAYEQPELGARVKEIIEVDGYQFKDMNGNGELDLYEDWRQPTDLRVANLLGQMTLTEKVGLLFCQNTSMQFSGTYPVTYNYLYQQECPYELEGADANGSGYSTWYLINSFNINCFLDNANGTPEEQIFVHNEIQQMCEETRLGIPAVFTCDREYNAWGGFIDSPKTAFGFANDPELSAALWARYAQESRAVGVHVALQPYGNEIGSFNGEDPAYIAKMTYLEVSSLEQNGLNACTKHWIARGGDSSFGNARSVAQTVDNWLEGWKAAIDAGTSWIMTNSAGLGFSNVGSLDYDTEAMDYLRNELGFEGVIVTDWWALSVAEGTVDQDGVDIYAMNTAERYNRMLRNGIDVFGTVSAYHGTNDDEGIGGNWPDAIIYGVEEGIIAEELVDRAATRVLKNKFDLGLFENPYSDTDAALALCATEEYAATHGEIASLEEYTAAERNITTNEDLKAVRPADVVELEEALQASSTVLVKNDDDLLPLAEGTRVHLTTTSEETTAHFNEYLSEHFTVVETMEEADVVIGLFTAINDVAELFAEDAQDMGKKSVMALNNTNPNAWSIENSDALLQLTFSRGADHGTAMPGFISTMEPWVFTEILVGEKEPTGMIVKELARDTLIDGAQWKDLAGDQGASEEVRLMLLAMMKTDENHATPNNWGDPLLCYEYGMRYGIDPVFEYDTLVMPTSESVVETEVSPGSTSTSVESIVTAKAGVPFTIRALLWNHGGDGLTNVAVYDNDILIAEKLMAVGGGSWRVVSIDITLDTVGEHTIRLGDLTGTITIAE